MTTLRADRLFFYLLLILVTLVTGVLVWRYMGAVVLAVTFAVVLQPMHDFYLRRMGQRTGTATAFTLITSVFLIVVPVLLGSILLLDSFAALSGDVAQALTQSDSGGRSWLDEAEKWLQSTDVAQLLRMEEEDLTNSIRSFAARTGADFLSWIASIGVSTFNLIVPMIVFISLLGTLLTNDRRAVQLIKELSPLDDDIDQLFLNRLNIMTRAMMRSIVIIALVQGVVTGLIMALGGTPHIVPLTILAVLFSILPGGAAIIAVPVGLVHVLVGNTWAGALIIAASVTFVASLDNQVRPLLVSKDAYLNRAFVLLSVFSGIALFGFMGVVYGPLIMILFTTTLEVYIKYYRPGPPDVTMARAELLPAGQESGEAD